MSTRKPPRILSLFLSLALVLAGTPCPAIAQETTDAVERWSDDIPTLLAAGEYAEGEALVGLVGAGDTSGLIAQDELPGNVEALMDVDGADVLANADAATPGQLVAQAEQEGVTLAVITSDSMSTEELLYALAENDRVVFAEPNYLTETTDEEAEPLEAEDPSAEVAVEAEVPVEEEAPEQPADEAETYTVGANSDQALVPAADSTVADLTPLQWSHTNNTTVRTSSMADQDPSHSANVPNFGATGSNMDQEVRVAVFDSLVDYTNPDLANVVYHFSADEMNSLGCGEWGYNATNDGGQAASDFRVDNHATHCAGIIGAEWDGKGVSGAASKARIVSIQVSDAVPGKGWIKYDSLLRGFAFVDKFNKNCANDADKIRVCSLSIGTAQASRAMDAAVRAVGSEHGTVSVFSAGNDATCNDSIVRFTSTLRQNPYALAVASIDTAGNLSTFSNWGPETVTLGAPGTSILSTLTTDSAAYFPDAAVGTSNSLLYEGFEGSSFNFDLVQINSDDSKKAEPECPLTSGNQPRFAGEHATLVPVDASLCNATDDGNVAHFLLTLDVSSCFDQLLNGSNLQFAIAFSGKGNSVKMASIQDYNSESGANLTIKRNDDSSTGGWSDVCADFGGVTITADKKVTLVLNIITAADTGNLAIDSIGIGTSSVPYGIMDGTSMATPVVAGCTAVYAAKHPTDNGAQLAARVRASVTKTDQMANITYTGGIIDMANDVEGTVVDVPPVTPSFPLYEQTLRFDTSTGDDPFEYDSMGDTESYGKLVELNGMLYYLTCWGTVRTNNSYLSLAYQPVNVFNLASERWIASKSTQLPSVLANVSACAYDGKLWVMGGKGTVVDGIPFVDPTGETAVYSYDPATGEWAEHNTTGLDIWADMVLFADLEGLKVLDAGETEGAPESRRNAAIYTYNPTSGRGNTLVKLNRGLGTPCVAVNGDTTYLIDNLELSNGSAELITVLDGEATTTTVTIPKALKEDRATAGLDANTESVSFADQNSEYNVTLLVGDDALYLVGHTDVNKTADTWMLPYGETAFKPYEKHLAATRPIQTTAAIYEGKIYAIASAWGEQDGRIFRATQAEEIPTEPIIFTDVDSTNPDESKRTSHYNDILWLAENGISTGWKNTDSGTYEFRGTAPVVRQDMAAFLRRLAKSEGVDVSLPEDYKNPFRDVFPPDENGKGGTPHYEDILWLAYTGISKGWDMKDGTFEFRGGETVKRQDMAAFLQRLSKYVGGDYQDLSQAIHFNDVIERDGGTPHWQSILWLSSSKVTTGFPDKTYRGSNGVIRQDMAAFLHRLDTYIRNTMSE